MPARSNTWMNVGKVSSASIEADALAQAVYPLTKVSAALEAAWARVAG